MEKSLHYRVGMKQVKNILFVCINGATTLSIKRLHLTLSITILCHNAECRYAEYRFYSFYAELQYDACRYAECRYAECRGAAKTHSLFNLFHTAQLCNHIKVPYLI
jgi:hypothetical protein